MPTPRWIQIVVFVSGALWLGLLILQGASVQVDWLRSLGGIAGVITMGVLVFDRYAWKWPGVHRLTHRRVLHGSWRGTLVSNWVNPGTGQGVPPTECYLVIHQTYSEISVALMTAESSSRSITAGVHDPARGQCLLSAIYQNTPDLLIQDRSRIHRGGVILEIAGSPPESLNGFYWTDRDSKGEMTFEEHSPKPAERFKAAQAMF